MEYMDRNISKYNSFFDFVLMVGVFMLGVVFAWLMGQDGKNKQIEMLINQIQGEKGKLERVQEKTKKYESSMYFV